MSESIWKRPRPEALGPHDLYMLGLDISRYDYQSIYYNLLLTGQRVSEALKLRPKDFDYQIIYDERIEKDRPVLYVNSITLKNKKRKLRKIQVFDLVKYVKKDDKFITTPYWDVWKALEPRINKMGMYDKEINIWGNLSRQNVESAFSKLEFTTRAYMPKKNKYKELKIRMYPHYLRHCRATEWGKLLKPVQLAQQMGWSDLRMTMDYVDTPLPVF